MNNIDKLHEANAEIERLRADLGRAIETCKAQHEALQEKDRRLVAVTAERAAANERADGLAMENIAIAARFRLVKERADTAEAKAAQLEAGLRSLASEIRARDTVYDLCTMADHMQSLCGCRELATALDALADGGLSAERSDGSWRA